MQGRAGRRKKIAYRTIEWMDPTTVHRLSHRLYRSGSDTACVRAYPLVQRSRALSRILARSVVAASHGRSCGGAEGPRLSISAHWGV